MGPDVSGVSKDNSFIIGNANSISLAIVIVIPDKRLRLCYCNDSYKWMVLVSGMLMFDLKASRIVVGLM